MSETVLELRDIEAGYGRAALVLRGLSVDGARPARWSVSSGRTAPESPLCSRWPAGCSPHAVERCVLAGQDVTGRGPQALLKLGLSHVLQGHSVFREMTVEENVRLGGYTVRDKATLNQRIDSVKDVFPVVAERWKTIAGLLSGGQQKQVEFARSLMLAPKVVLLDEPSMGLDPKTTETVFAQIERMRAFGVAVLLVEQNARRALQMADVGCVLDLGRVHISGPAAELLDDPRLGALYLGGSVAEAPKAAASGLIDAVTSAVPTAPTTPTATTPTAD